MGAHDNAECLQAADRVGTFRRQKLEKEIRDGCGNSGVNQESGRTALTLLGLHVSDDLAYVISRVYESIQ
jgi:hypothetical protein